MGLYLLKIAYLMKFYAIPKFRDLIFCFAIRVKFNQMHLRTDYLFIYFFC